MEKEIDKNYAIKKAPDLTDITILSTPLPQATSTVDRRSQQGRKRRSTLDDQNSKHRQLNFDYSNAEQNTDESSLGIIQNISSLLGDSTLEDPRNQNSPKKDLERKKSTECYTRDRARELLQKCHDSLLINPPNKENDINSTNLQRYSIQKRLANGRSSQSSQNCLSNIDSQSLLHKRLSNIRESQCPLSSQSQKQKHDLDQKSIVSDESIVFSPNEISARSSELNKTPEKTEPFPQTSLSDFSYNTNVAEMMAQFRDEEFMSGSKAGSQILADEISWKKNKFLVHPVINNNSNNNNEKDRLELSCFSGIIGDIDLTVDSGRVSVGNYFQRKCGGTGHLSITSASDRPSFGLNSKSPQRKGTLRPLVDQTINRTIDLTEGSFLSGNKTSKSIDCTKEPSLMSVTSIGQALKEIESGTPGKLVDQLLAYKKQKKQRAKTNNLAGDTYTLLPSNTRTSLPVLKTYFNDTPEKDLGNNSSLTSKFSLGNKNINDISGENQNEITNEENFMHAKLQQLIDMKLDDITLNSTKPTSNKSDNVLNFQQISSELKSPNASVARTEQSLTPRLRQLSHLPEKSNKLSSSTSINNKSSLIHDTIPPDLSDPTLSKNESTIKEINITDSSLKNYSFETRKFALSQNTQELCTCLVGIPKEAEFELHNGTDRWIICNLKLVQIQGEKENIQLTLPVDDILIEPDATKSIKIEVKMLRMSKLTIATFHIPSIDMVTRTNWIIKHLMCFVPEDPDIRISVPFDDIIINFETITEDTNSSLPISFENKNSIDIPIIVNIYQNQPQLFSIGNFLDDTFNISPQKESAQVILKPNQPMSMNIDFKGMSLVSFGEKVLQKGLYNAEARMRIFISFREHEEYLIKEIPLKGAIGSSKLDIIDTQFPLLLPPRMDRLVILKNSGSIAVSATADIVQSKENQVECRDFYICPNNIVLNGGEKLTLQISYKPENNKTDIEKYAVLRLRVGNKVSFYSVIGEKILENEQLNPDIFNQLQRCETPQRLRDVTSPVSPHSLGFNRSGTSGRYSPSSTASGGGPIPGVPIPIKASHTALVWGSIKIGKTDIKKINIRNTSNNKIKLLVSVTSDGNTFKLLKERQSTTIVATLTLQGMEGRNLLVVFAPHVPKPASGKITFSYCNSQRVTREPSGHTKMISLFGHGGNIKMDIEAVKDTSGQMWLSLGKINPDGIQHTKLRLQNTGNLTSFAKLKLVPKALYPSITSWAVEPTELLLAPNQIQWITIQYRPRKDDLAAAHQSGIIHVGTLKVTYGDEPTRLRIRRLYNKLKDSNQLQGTMNEESDEFQEVIYPLSKAFPGEVFPQDLRKVNDSVQNLGDLCKEIVQNEIKLTIEVHADETISMLNDNMDESQAFHSLCSDNDESYFGGDSFLPTE